MPEHPLDRLAKEAHGMTRAEALAQGVCISCKKPPRFYSDAGRTEYRISAMCEYCYDSLMDDELPPYSPEDVGNEVKPEIEHDDDLSWGD